MIKFEDIKKANYSVSDIIRWGKRLPRRTYRKLGKDYSVYLPEYKAAAISCLKEQLQFAKSEAFKTKLKNRISAWEART